MTALIDQLDCQIILRRLYDAYSNTINIKDFQILPLLEKSTGFFGIHSQLRIDLECKQGEKVSENIPNAVYLFLKALPQTPQHQKYIKEISAFKKEVNSFKILLPALQKISEALGSSWCPGCYLLKPDLLVFENLVETGFKNWKDNIAHLDFDHLVVAAKCLGYFHSSSLIFERRAMEHDTNFSMSDKFSDCLFESTYVEDETNVRHHWFSVGVATIIKMIGAMDKYNCELITKIEKRIPELINTIKESYKPVKHMTNVVNHGDLWINNLMFRYDRQGIPIECRLVDFQLVRYAPNTLDLACLVFLCSDRTTRDKHLTAIVGAYMDALNSQLSLAGFKEAMSMDTILREYNIFKMPALMEACLYEMVTRLDKNRVDEMLATPDDVDELFYGDRSRFVLPAFQEDLVYRKRLSELIEEFVENFILSNDSS